MGVYGMVCMMCIVVIVVWWGVCFGVWLVEWLWGYLVRRDRINVGKIDECGKLVNYF